MSQNAILYLIPSSLDPALSTNSVTDQVTEVIKTIQYFVVEDPRSARRFIRKCIPDFSFELVDIKQLSIKKKLFALEEYLAPILDGNAVGLLSEAGTPCIADPGSDLVAKAHEMGISIKPLSGPNAILLALMASGLNGQHFSFHGYLARDKSMLRKQLKKLEREMQRSGFTQIFIETPYRNNQMISMVINNLAAGTKFCVACDLTADTETIISLPIALWQKRIPAPDFHKRPAVFLIGE